MGMIGVFFRLNMLDFALHSNIQNKEHDIIYTSNKSSTADSPQRGNNQSQSRLYCQIHCTCVIYSNSTYEIYEITRLPWMSSRHIWHIWTMGVTSSQYINNEKQKQTASWIVGSRKEAQGCSLGTLHRCRRRRWAICIYSFNIGPVIVGHTGLCVQSPKFAIQTQALNLGSNYLVRSLILGSSFMKPLDGHALLDFMYFHCVCA